MGASTMAAAAGRANILLVDDQQARLLSYQAILDKLEQNLVFARSGEEALQCVLAHEFAVIILDVSMPGMDGFETAAMIHEHPRFERTPIIFVTGVHDSELDRLRGYKLGAVDYVGIPVVPDILRSKVSVLVELHHQRLALQELNKNLAEANDRLELAKQSLLIDKNRELKALNDDLMRSNADLASVNASLTLEVAERSRAEAALKTADRQKDEFIAVLAHELRNPLAPIRNAVEILQRLDFDDKRFLYARGVIDRQLNHMARLMDDLLDIARVTRGTIRLERVPLPVDRLIHRSVETSSSALAQRRQQLTVRCDDPDMHVEGDPIRLVQVVSNLLGNAAKYTPEDGQVEVEARRRGQSVEICVRDNGIGIEAEDIPNLFSLFSRVKTADNNIQDGLGIGLALVRKLVELHGGNVWVRSDGRNRGSEFFVRLPLCAAAVPAVVSSESGAPLGPLKPVPGSPTVLVADDNRDALDSLAVLMELQGYTVVKASNGHEAVEVAGLAKPRIMLIDIGMPGADGYEVARTLRAQPWCEASVLIAVSGWGQPQDVERAFAAGFDRHIVKPVDFAILAKILDERVLNAPGI